MEREVLPLPDFRLPVPDLDPSPPILPASGFDPFPRISPAGLRALLANPAAHGFDRVLVIDARFGYEWAAGHIHHSINVRTMSHLVNVFKENCECDVCVVFHCEWSGHRAPRLMRIFRRYDREMNITRYPELSFPSIYLLEGGYRRFFDECVDLCAGGCVSMRDATFQANGALQASFSTYLRDRRRRVRPMAYAFPTFDLDDGGLLDAEAREEEAWLHGTVFRDAF
jgi:M-phase inducer tyrosine phosphatase